MLALHIAIALISIISYGARLVISNRVVDTLAPVSAIAPFASGLLLIVTSPTSLGHACISGTIYLAAVVALAHSTRRVRA